eukprot:361814-Chlamydomonas_euryale.AAC.1
MASLAPAKPRPDRQDICCCCLPACDAPAAASVHPGAHAMHPRQRRSTPARMRHTRDSVGPPRPACDAPATTSVHPDEQQLPIGCHDGLHKGRLVHPCSHAAGAPCRVHQLPGSRSPLAASGLAADAAPVSAFAQPVNGLEARPGAPVASISPSAASSVASIGPGAVSSVASIGPGAASLRLAVALCSNNGG